MKKLAIIKKPVTIVEDEKKGKAIDLIWPEIIEWVQRNPETTDKQLFNLFGPRSNTATFEKFRHRCSLRGLKDLRMTVNAKTTMKDSRQLTEKSIADFKEQRKEAGIGHLGKMHKYLERAHNSVEKESIKVEEKGGKGLQDHLFTLSQMQKVAKDVYGIDKGPDNEVNSVKLNLAIITRFDPLSAQAPESPVIEMEG